MFLEKDSPVIDVLVASVFHKSSINCINSGFQLMLWHPPPVAQHLKGQDNIRHTFARRRGLSEDKRTNITDLATNVLTDGGGSIQLQQHVGFQQVLGPVHLKVGHRGGQPHPLVLDVEHHVLLVQLVRDKVDAPESGVLVAGVEALEAVGNAKFGAVLCEGV